MPTDPPIADLSHRIVRAVHDCWDREKIPLLLSRLGNQDGGDFSRGTKRHGTTLRQYLLTQLSEHLTVIQHSESHQLVGVLPIQIDVSAAGGADMLLERTQRCQADTTPRFHPALWAAFRKPLPESQRRYISDRSPVSFWDLDALEHPKGVEIARDYILPDDASSIDVRQNIQLWIEANRLDVTIYLRTHKEPLQSLDSRDLLECVLDALNSEELKRVIMPLDVVSKLKRHFP